MGRLDWNFIANKMAVTIVVTVLLCEYMTR